MAKTTEKKEKKMNEMAHAICQDDEGERDECVAGIKEGVNILYYLSGLQ